MIYSLMHPVHVSALAHVCIKTTDLAGTLDFYIGALGMEKLFDFTRRTEVIGFYLKVSPDAFVEVFRADEVVRGGANQNLHHFCLETPDIEATRKVLDERGYAPGPIKMGADNSLQFWVKDPGGVDVEFHQYTEQSAQLTGASVEVNW